MEGVSVSVEARFLISALLSSDCFLQRPYSRQGGGEHVSKRSSPSFSYFFLCRYKSSLSHLAEIKSRFQQRCVFIHTESFQTRRSSTKGAFVNVSRLRLRASRFIHPNAYQRLSESSPHPEHWHGFTLGIDHDVGMLDQYQILAHSH